MRQYYALDAGAPPGVQPNNPSISSWPLTEGQLLRVEITVPAGHAGLTGIMLLSQGTQVVPWGAGTWLAGNDERFTFDPDLPIADSGLTVVMFNLGHYTHFWHLRATVDTPPAASLSASVEATTLAIPPVYAGVSN